jgi:hypothetical protein
MDSRDNFLIKFKAYVESINEDYLIGVTNKGIFNRAVKDLGSGEGIKAEFEDSCLVFTLPDGSTCRINEDITKFKCSCPSRSVCKHVVMSYLYVRQFGTQLFAGKCTSEEVSSAPEEKPDYAELLRLDIDSIKKALGDRDFGSIAKRLEFKLKAEIEEGSMLQVKFADEDTIVRFIPSSASDSKEKLNINDSVIVKNCLCSCKAKELCRHKAEAVVHYNIFKGILSKETVTALAKKGINFNKEQIKDALKRVKNIIGQIYITGLSRMPESCAEDIEQSAVICHSSGLPRLEKALRAIRTELLLYLSKNASFSLPGYRKLLQNAYGAAAALEAEEDSERLLALAGEHKTTYYDIPPIELYSVGARSWSTKSGYEGITFYFTSPGHNKWFTFTSSRPKYYEGVKTDKLLEESCPWNIPGKIGALGKSRIRLVNGKLNDEFRLSSSESSCGDILGSTSINKIELADRTFSNWKKLLGRMADFELMEYKDREENYNLLLLKPASYGKSSFDNIVQLFSMAVYDEEGHQINISIKYTIESKRLIENIERAEKNARLPYMLLAEVYMGNNGLSVVPITAYYKNNTMENWTLE